VQLRRRASLTLASLAIGLSAFGNKYYKRTLLTTKGKISILVL
jgi:hypothetical protein